jgi:hypothetical protein
MPLDSLGGTALREPNSTAPLIGLVPILPQRQNASDAEPATQTGLVIDALSAPDGVRILDAVAPSELAKFYQHEVSSRLQVLQSWEGVVTLIDPERREFTARLYDLTDSAADESEAVFDLNDVSTNDGDLVKIGAVFRWMIGYRRHNYGQQERVSAIVFRRLPAWYETDIQSAVEYGEKLAGTIPID